jgi:hypothetical protein
MTNPATMTTIIAPTPWVPGEVEALRAELDWAARLGVPAHITLLGPFIEPAAIDADVHRRLETVLRAHAPIMVSLDRLELIGDVACLLPGDTRAIAAVQSALHREWPELEPRSLQHVTVARELNRSGFEAVIERIEPMLPLSGRLDRASLIVGRNRRASTRATFRLGG